MSANFVVDGQMYSVPTIDVHTQPVFRIQEGPFEGVWFTLTNMRMDDAEEGLLHYEIDVAGAAIEEIKPIVDAFIIKLVRDQVDRAQAE